MRFQFPLRRTSEYREMKIRPETNLQIESVNNFQDRFVFAAGSIFAVFRVENSQKKGLKISE